MYAFTYHQPTTLSDAARLLRESEQPKLLAGGQTLLPSLKLRLAGPQDLIDLGKIPDLEGIAKTGDALEIGSMTRHAGVAASGEVASAIPALASLAGQIGDRMVRNRGTIGGSIANNDPSADYPAACVALDAEVETNDRTIPADDFFQGLFETALEPGEIVTRVRFRIPRTASWIKFRNPASRFAMIGVFVAAFEQGVRLAVTGASQTGVFRWREAEERLARNFTPDALKDAAMSEVAFLEDLHADAEYRAHLVRVLSERAIAAAR